MKTTHEYRGFVFTIDYEARDPAYVVDFPDIPEIITSGQTLSENAKKALMEPSNRKLISTASCWSVE